ncbi:hypothetical protein H2O64_18975 [Kordia sp. YSTF-M3]|uniref:Uncharacterized protein n=1 Tax=Kordia aestuariivivens TaxID=2759037 RepID=A0ABR7QDW3_9FLAO|nr:hypothetical protein [Kordia aestuariivivens]MBC8756765.1 hypothetical protein [Kordia aestuariivivens]
MKSNFTYIVLFLSLLLCVNCAEKDKKTAKPTTDIEAEKQAKSKDSIKDAATIEEIENIKSKIVHHYICYKNDDKTSMQLSIAFNDEGNALFVKYKGQKGTIPLKNVKEDYEEGGAYPTITQFYHEMYEGKKNGVYELTHSGNWDYATYTSEKDGEQFKFTIDHETTVVAGEYRKTPCF